MSGSNSSLKSQAQAVTHPKVGSFVTAADNPTEDSLPMKSLAFELELQSMTALLTVLTTIARLGGEVSYLLACALRVQMTLLVPGHTAHRVEPLLGEIIGVVSLKKPSPGSSTRTS